MIGGSVMDPDRYKPFWLRTIHPYYKEKSILVPKIPKIDTRCRLSGTQTKVGILEFNMKKIVKMKGVLHYVA